MANIGPSLTSLPTSTTPPSKPCGMGGPSIPPLTNYIPTGFTLPAPPTGSPVLSAERFRRSAAGGVILGADNKPTGSIPAGSYVDSTNGTIYGPDNKAIAIPAGSSVDFFDLPSIKRIIDSYVGEGVAAPTKSAVNGVSGSGAPAKTEVGGASGSGAPMKTAVDGMWGPGGVTPIKGGGATAATDDECATDHATDHAGHGSSNAITSLQAQMAQQIAALNASLSTMAGGPTTAVAGVNGLGQVPGLETSLKGLISVLRELAEAVQSHVAKTTGGGPTIAPPAKTSTTTTDTSAGGTGASLPSSGASTA